MRPVLMLAMLLCSSLSRAADIPSALFGIALGESIENLEGVKTRSKGVVRIKGKGHAIYQVDARQRQPDSPLTDVMVTVGLEDGRIVVISGAVDLDELACEEAAVRLKSRVESRFSIKLNKLEHQGDTFYSLEEDGRVISVGCQNKRRSKLQYQVGLLGG